MRTVSGNMRFVMSMAECLCHHEYSPAAPVRLCVGILARSGAGHRDLSQSPTAPPIGAQVATPPAELLMPLGQEVSNFSIHENYLECLGKQALGPCPQ